MPLKQKEQKNYRAMPMNSIANPRSSTDRRNSVSKCSEEETPQEANNAFSPNDVVLGLFSPLLADIEQRHVVIRVTRYMLITSLYPL